MRSTTAAPPSCTSRSVTPLSRCHAVTLSRCHAVTLSPCHPVTLSPCHPVALSPCHPVPCIYTRSHPHCHACLLQHLTALAASTPLTDAPHAISAIPAYTADADVTASASPMSRPLDLDWSHVDADVITAKPTEQAAAAPAVKTSPQASRSPAKSPQNSVSPIGVLSVAAVVEGAALEPTATATATVVTPSKPFGSLTSAKPLAKPTSGLGAKKLTPSTTSVAVSG